MAMLRSDAYKTSGSFICHWCPAVKVTRLPAPGSIRDCKGVSVLDYTAFSAPGWRLLWIYHHCCMKKALE